ncbi:SUMF1/EgtB/PvdO family nonheme iron enzyme [Synechococcus sp. PCC 7336]|uniref:SUMF1/EgtB/PvdO family nonheme iron enzyme n=1 Tax=Synechococcus sp. PCC 7336 TaxID=195250 RepID=UPI00034D97F8|nr:SUMF1/EgtB/PvdO family nonheme iron enzyme [Synechococcus sp. PCC 7336]
MIEILNLPQLIEPSKEEIYTYFRTIWQLYEWLFSGIQQSEEAFSVQPHPLRNTIAFYYGHTAAFYAQKLRMSGLLSAEIHADYDEKLSRGVSASSAQEIAALQQWPQLDELKRYRRQVYDAVESVIETARYDAPITPQTPLWALLMSIEHEAIHFQTSVPLIRKLPLKWVSRPDGWHYAITQTPIEVNPQWLEIAGGQVTFGREQSDSTYFGWDNEYPQVSRQVEDFRVLSLPITNRQFLNFVEDGGYERSQWWTTGEVAAWFAEMSPTHPTAWVKNAEGGYRHRGVFDEFDMPWDWPVEVNRHEAVAYANWANSRLLTEAEFNYLLTKEYSNAEGALQLKNVNLNMRHASPLPVASTSQQLTRSDLDLVGNIARWGQEDFQPLSAKEFQPHPLYEDFSQPWFRPDHGMLLGAGYTAVGHMAQVGLMRDFMQNHMDQIAGITLAGDR